MIALTPPEDLHAGDTISLTLYLSDHGRVEVTRATVRGVQPVEDGHLIQLQDAEGALCAAVAVGDDALVARHTEGGDGQ